MGFRFSLHHANWVAHILQPSGATPVLEHEFEAAESLNKLLEAARHDFYGGRRHRHDFYDALHEARAALMHGDLPREAIAPLQEYFKQVPWIALLIPSGSYDFDRFFSSREFLDELVRIRPDDPGLVLQLEKAPQDQMRTELGHVFPAFRVALANATRWPGVLVWTPAGDAAFFETPLSIDGARESLRWLFSHLSVTYGRPDLALVLQQFRRNMQPADGEAAPLRVIHLSDLHLGSRLAQRRLPRVKQLIRLLADELGEHAPVVPIVTGDIMDTPEDAHLDSARDFIEFLHGVGSEDPVLVLGNHDVRKDGWLNPDLQNALRIQADRVRWFDKSQVGFACFNSVRGGHLARGRIDETEFMDVGVALDRDSERAGTFTLAALLHHHPIAVDRPSWYRQEWFEKLLGRAFEKTDALENADAFMSWLRARRIGLVAHGHKHIPRVEVDRGVTVVGCGSTVGKVETTEAGTTYMSINVITIDAARGRVSCRLRAERIPGGGFGAEELHETLLTASTFRGDA